AVQFGLEERAKGIDNGSIANYFGFSARPIYAGEPTRLVVAGRFGGDGELSRLIQVLGRAGYSLLTSYNRVSGQGLFLYDYVFRFGGAGRLAAVQDGLAPFKTARLVGAFVARA